MSDDKIRARIRAVVPRIVSVLRTVQEFPPVPSPDTDGDRGRLFLLVEFNYFCATRRELRRGQASTGTPSVRSASVPSKL